MGGVDGMIAFAGDMLFLSVRNDMLGWVTHLREPQQGLHA